MGFFSAFTGKAQKKDLMRADAKATAALDQGYGQQQGYYDQAAGLMDPYAQEGRQAGTFYNNALGLNGADAANEAYGTMAGNPIFQGQLAQDSNAVARMLNARGAGGGGQAQLAGQRVFQQNMGNWLDRYKQQGQQGFQATNALAGLRTGQGDNAMGYGATKAGQSINYGNALAASRGIGVNNLMGLAGTALKAYGAMYPGGTK